MQSRHVFIPFNSTTGKILQEKFISDAYFAVTSIKNEEEYNKTFLEYRKKLIDLAKNISQIALKEYQKKVMDLNFIITNLNAFYYNNPTIRIHNLEENIDILAWFFSNYQKIRQNIGIDIKLKNISGFEKLKELKEAIEEKNIPFFDLWENVISFLLQEKDKNKFVFLYPLPFRKETMLESEVIAIILNRQYKNLDALFNFFRKLMMLTNKYKSSTLCIFTNQKSFVEYLENYHIVVFIFHPKTGFYSSENKKGLIAHVLSMKLSDNSVAEIADYMNDHDIDFPASLEVLKDIEELIANDLFDNPQKHLGDLERYISFIRSVLNNIKTEHISKFNNIIKAIVDYDLKIETYNKAKHFTYIKTTALEKTIEKAIYDYIKNKNLNAEFKDFIKNLDQVREAFGENNFNILLNLYKNTFGILVKQRLFKETNSEKNIQTKLVQTAHLETEKQTKLVFDTTIEIAPNAKQFDFRTTLTLPSRATQTYNMDEIVNIFKNENKDVFSNEKVQEITTIVANQILKEDLSLEDINFPIRYHFTNLINFLYSTFFLKKSIEKSANLIDKILASPIDLKEIILRSVKKYLIELNLYSHDEEEIMHFLETIVLGAGINNLDEIINSISQTKETLEKIMEGIEFYSEDFSSRSITFAYFKGINTFKSVSAFKNKIKPLIKFFDFIYNLVKDLKAFLENFSETITPSEFFEILKLCRISINNAILSESLKEVIDEVYTELMKIIYKNFKEKYTAELNDMVRKYILETISFDIFNIIINEM